MMYLLRNLTADQSRLRVARGLLFFSLFRQYAQHLDVPIRDYFFGFGPVYFSVRRVHEQVLIESPNRWVLVFAKPWICDQRDCLAGVYRGTWQEVHGGHQSTVSWDYVALTVMTALKLLLSIFRLISHVLLLRNLIFSVIFERHKVIDRFLIGVFFIVFDSGKAGWTGQDISPESRQISILRSYIVFSTEFAQHV